MCLFTTAVSTRLSDSIKTPKGLGKRQKYPTAQEKGTKPKLLDFLRQQKSKDLKDLKRYLSAEFGLSEREIRLFCNLAKTSGFLDAPEVHYKTAARRRSRRARSTRRKRRSSGRRRKRSRRSPGGRVSKRRRRRSPRRSTKAIRRRKSGRRSGQQSEESIEGYFDDNYEV